MDRLSKKFNILISLLTPFIFLFSHNSVFAEDNSWYAGTWDFNLHLDGRHPTTVALRMEFMDKNTHLPIEGVQVSLEGEYWEQWISQNIVDAERNPGLGVFVDPEKREPQQREFKMKAVSDPRGLVVFSLQWLKEYPWDSKIGDKWTYSVHDSWIIYIDEIEKVQRLKARHPRYNYVESPLNFGHIVNLDVYKDTSEYGNKERKFEALWKNEIKRKNTKLCVFDFEKGFDPGKESGKSKNPEFFRRIAAKKYGMVFQDIDNVFGREGEIKGGPYIVYDLGEILLEPAASQIEVVNGQGRDENRNESSPVSPREAKERKAKTEDSPKKTDSGDDERQQKKDKEESATRDEEAKKKKDKEEADSGPITLTTETNCPELYMGLQSINPTLRKRMGLSSRIEGVIISEIMSGAPAGHDSLRIGDVITSLNDETITNIDALVKKANYIVTRPAVLKLKDKRDQARLSYSRLSNGKWGSETKMIWIVNRD
jgi:hypothetical protein